MSADETILSKPAIHYLLLVGALVRTYFGRAQFFFIGYSFTRAHSFNVAF